MMWWILGIVLLVLAALVFLLSYLMMRFACGRLDSLFADLEKALDRPTYQECKAEILAGRDWLVSMQPEQVTIRSYDGLRLVGELIPCEHARGTILLFHGWRGSPVTDFGFAIQEYYKLGLNLLLVHQRAQGKSEGRYITFGVRESRDVHSWVQWHGERFGPDAPVLLGGLSMGASTVLMACASPFPSSVRGVIADCGFTTPEAIIRSVMRRAHLPAKLTTALLGVQTRLFAGFSLREASTLEAMKKTKLPIFLAHGEADMFVPCEMSKQTYAACRSPDKTLLLVPNAEHGKSLLRDRTGYLTQLRAFVDRALEEKK